MRVLIIHAEAEYFAGAEKVLGYFLEGLAAAGTATTVAAVQKSRVAGIIPPEIGACWLPQNAKFSLASFSRQAQAIRRQFKVERFDVIHGWAARDWELTALASKLTGCPALGTLHDHPRAPFISRARQRLMYWSAAFGLRKVACVSGAVQKACLEAGYAEAKLAVVRNGLPPLDCGRSTAKEAPCRLGFLGVFSERKGLRGLFQILDELSLLTDAPWEMALAGDAQDRAGRSLVQQIEQSFSNRAWWPRVRWCGWVNEPMDFLRAIDVLVCPSSEFDPFPTVILEAGQASVPVLGARVGGVPEILQDNETGWLFEPSAWREAALRLKEVVETPELARKTGMRAKKRVEQEFAIRRMVGDYLRLYTNLKT